MSSIRYDDRGVLPLIAWVAVLLGLGVGMLVLLAIFKTLAIIVGLIVMVVIIYLVFRSGAHKQKSGVAIALVALLVIPIFLLVMLGPAAVFDIDTNTQKWTRCALQGEGTFLGPDGESDELLTQTMYISSHSPTEESQRLTAQGRARYSGGALNLPTLIKNWRYKWYVDDPPLSSEEVRSIDYSPSGTGISDVWDAPSDTWYLTGTYPIKKLRVELWVDCLIGGYARISEDAAYLYPGIGQVFADDQAQVGDTVTVSWQVPYVRDEIQNSGWTIVGYSLASGQQIANKELTTERGSFTYTVKDSDFSTDKSKRNELEWHLRNNLWNKDWKTTTTVDKLELAPSITDPTIKGDAKAGGTIIVSWKATPNPTSKDPIERIILKHGCGGIENEEELPGSETEYSIVLENACENYRVEVIAYDESNRPSPTGEAEFRVIDPNKEGDDLPGGISIWFWLALLLFVVIALFMVWLLPGKPVLKIIYFLIPFIVFITLVIAGVIPL